LQDGVGGERVGVAVIIGDAQILAAGVTEGEITPDRQAHIAEVGQVVVGGCARPG
jgi:hypothetical protein